MLRIASLILSTLGLAALAWAGQIHYAAKSGSVDQVKRLIAAGTEVDEKDDNGATPLIIGGVFRATESRRLLDLRRRRT